MKTSGDINSELDGSELDSDYRQAILAQKMAADPQYTRLVSANAGSGKTHVLVNRISRILLTGTPPEKILCLTYTKAAAAEMQSRLFETLGVTSAQDGARFICQGSGNARWTKSSNHSCFL